MSAMVRGSATQGIIGYFVLMEKHRLPGVIA